MKLVAEQKDIVEVYEGDDTHGHSTMYVVCPFCSEENEVYNWSFAACGKKCSGNGCSAHLTRFSGAHLVFEVNEAQLEIMKDLKSFIIADPDYSWMPSKRSLNALVKKGLIEYGVNKKKTQFGYMLTDIGKKCLEDRNKQSGE